MLAAYSKRHIKLLLSGDKKTSFRASSFRVIRQLDRPDTSSLIYGLFIDSVSSTLYTVVTSSGAHSSFCSLDTKVSSFGVKRPKYEVDHSLTSSAEFRNVWIFTSTLSYIMKRLVLSRRGKVCTVASASCWASRCVCCCELDPVILRWPAYFCFVTFGRWIGLYMMGEYFIEEGHFAAQLQFETFKWN